MVRACCPGVPLERQRLCLAGRCKVSPVTSVLQAGLRISPTQLSCVWLILLPVLDQALKLQSVPLVLFVKAARKQTSAVESDPARLQSPSRAVISSHPQGQARPKPPLLVQQQVLRVPVLPSLLVQPTQRKCPRLQTGSPSQQTALVPASVLAALAAARSRAIVGVNLHAPAAMELPAQTPRSPIARTAPLLRLLLLLLALRRMVPAIGPLTAKARRISRRERTRHCIAFVRKSLLEIWSAATTTIASISGSIGVVSGSRASRQGNGFARSAGNCQRGSWP